MLRQGREKSNIALRIKHQPVDVCPLCEGKLDGLNKNYICKVVDGDKTLFYAHKRCVITFGEVLDMFKEL
jgi:hypothetical protein